MRKFIVAALAAAALLPSAAMAQNDHGRRADTRVVVVDHRPAATPVAWHRPAAAPRIVVGTRLEPALYGDRYRVAHPGRYQLARATAHQRWVRVHDDAVLVNLRNGHVVAVKYRLFR